MCGIVAAFRYEDAEGRVDADTNFPHEILKRPKFGFSVPLDCWLKTAPEAAGAFFGLQSWALELYQRFSGVAVKRAKA